MLIDEFIISVFCCVEDLFSQVVGHMKLRQRGFLPKLTDVELLTMEVVGEFIGRKQIKKSGNISSDTGITGFLISHVERLLHGSLQICGKSNS